MVPHGLPWGIEHEANGTDPEEPAGWWLGAGWGVTMGAVLWMWSGWLSRKDEAVILDDSNLDANGMATTDGRHLSAHQGWWFRKRVMIDWHKLQAVELTQNRIHARRNVAHLTFHTSSGVAHLRFLPTDVARELTPLPWSTSPPDMVTKSTPTDGPLDVRRLHLPPIAGGLTQGTPSPTTYLPSHEAQ